MTEHLKVDNIDQFMSDIEKYPRLTHEQERELGAQMHGSDPEKAAAARETLITSNLRLVVKVAHQFKKYIPLKDAVQEGCLGLMMAVDKFDPDRCSKLSVVVGLWCKQCIRKAILSKSRNVRVPGTASQRAARIAKIKHRYEFQENRTPTNAEIAAELGISEQRVESNKIADIGFCSLDEKVSEDSAVTYEDMLIETIDDRDDAPEDMPDAIKDLRMLIYKLPDRDQFILTRSYGIGCEPVPVDVISQETGMCARNIQGRLYNLYRHLHAVMTDKSYSF